VSIDKNGTASLNVELVPEETAQAAAQAKPAETANLDAPQAPTQPLVADAPTRAPERMVSKSAPRIEKKEAASTKAATAKTDSPKKSDVASATPAAMGTLNINSIPVANVVLDGRPMGSTPLIGVSVSAGPHSVVFVHPEKGRKASGTTVAAGGTSTVAVRF
jgi:serine/threonine-protein kinase